ncbi:hypothetical protein D7V86_14475 [bacterium D16-51]|nr:hypothetical protein D7V96_23845 [bacterium D16-59]RKI58909.1 hypothetical protein D7V86_14475 [bacterium D16-51]
MGNAAVHKVLKNKAQAPASPYSCHMVKFLELPGEYNFCAIWRFKGILQTRSGRKGKCYI